MNTVVLEMSVVMLLLLANGAFAMTEMALVSARKVRLRQMAERGDERARVALELASSPNRFLSTVQLGITLIGVLAGAFSGATLAGEIARRVARLPALASYADAIGIGAVVMAITFLSVLIGELVPKRVALANPEKIARLIARPMQLLARIASPAVRLMSAATEGVLRLLGFKQPETPPVTEEEINLLVREGVRAGVFDRHEPQMVAGVLALDQLPVHRIMTPRRKMVMLHQDDPHEIVWHKIVVCSHSNFPVYDRARGQIVGIVSVKSIYANLAAGVPVRLTDLMTRPQIFPAKRTVGQLLDEFKKTGQHIALVADDAGEIVGLVTLIDVMEAIVGDIPSLEERLKPVIRPRADGTWLVDAFIEMGRLEKTLPGFIGGVSGATTLADFMANRLPQTPKEGDVIEAGGYRFEVIDLDRERVDKLLVMPAGKSPWPA